MTAAGGEFFDSPRAYKAAVGRRLFGLDEAAYDELLRLLYWLRSPQVGESVEVSQLDRTLSESLPELDRSVVEAAAASLDELQEFGEQVERRERASNEVQKALNAYRRYAAGEVLRRARGLLEANAEHEAAQRALTRAQTSARNAVQQRAEAGRWVEDGGAAQEAATTRLHQLQTSQEARDLEALEQMRLNADTLARVYRHAAEAAGAAQVRQDEAAARRDRQQATRDQRRTAVDAEIDETSLRAAGIVAPGPAPATLDLLPEHGQELTRVAAAVGAALAAVEVCLQAVATWEKAVGEQQRAEDREAEAGVRLEQAGQAADLADADVAAGRARGPRG
jgi:hypothetical protein